MAEETRPKTTDDGEGTLALVKHLTDEIARLRAQLAANNDRIEELERLADTDPLTPTMNRRAFIRELSRTAAFTGRYGGEAWLMYLDLDGMKSINDSYGHAAGDEALKAVAHTLSSNLRASDSVGRLGGDEFGVILHRVDEKFAQEKAAALMADIEACRVQSAGDRIPLSVSCGITRIDSDMNIEETLENADQAMYAVKAAK